MCPCDLCGHGNTEDAVACEDCGTVGGNGTGDSGDNKDSEDLFFDDECIKTHREHRNWHERKKQRTISVTSRVQDGAMKCPIALRIL